MDYQKLENSLIDVIKEEQAKLGYRKEEIRLYYPLGSLNHFFDTNGNEEEMTELCAAIFPMPVIGIPMHTTSLGGRDSLYSIVQMPTGIPVATVAINGGANAGILAAKILATSDADLLARLKEYSKNLKEQVEAKDARLKEVGYKNY